MVTKNMFMYYNVGLFIENGDSFIARGCSEEPLTLEQSQYCGQVLLEFSEGFGHPDFAKSTQKIRGCIASCLLKDGCNGATGVLGNRVDMSYLVFTLALTIYLIL